MFLAQLAFLVPVVFQFVSVQASPTCTRYYTVQAGDICDSISAKNNVSTYQLAAVNYGIIDMACDNLSPGQKLCLGQQGEDCTTTHVVQPGDYCDEIAANYRLNETIFRSNNPQVDGDCMNLYVAEVVCVSQTVQVPPRPPNSTLPALIPANSPPSITWCD